jgi:hypothetical protein
MNSYGLPLLFVSGFLLFLSLVGCGVETAVPAPTTFVQPTATMTPFPTNIPAPTPSPACAPRTEKPLRYLALGDSYTIGESVEAAEQWPVQLVMALREQGVNIDDPQIIAKTGWTTAELTKGIEQTNPQGPYDLVSLLIG